MWTCLSYYGHFEKSSTLNRGLRPYRSIISSYGTKKNLKKNLNCGAMEWHTFISFNTDLQMSTQNSLQEKFWLLRQRFLINHKEQLILSLSFLSLLYPCQTLHVCVLSLYFCLSQSGSHHSVSLLSDDALPCSIFRLFISDCMDMKCLIGMCFSWRIKLLLIKLTWAAETSGTQSTLYGW